ncbi:MAG: GH32 C-terminal domain-containing protein [Ardenticatenaceae bacterium]
MHVQFDAPTSNIKRFGLILRWANDRTTRLRSELRSVRHTECRIGIDCQQQQIYIDRTQANQLTIHDIFNAIHTAPLAWDNNNSLTLRLIIDQTSLELFANAGQIVFTDLIFPQAPLVELATFAEGDEIRIKELIVREVKT